jgi:hypothetical protein
MKVYRVCALFFLLLSNKSFSGDVYFSCSTKIGRVLVQMLDENLEYSLSKQGVSAFEFKSSTNLSSEFRYNHFSRYQTDYFNISFVNHDYKYSVFSNYEDGKEKKGVAVLNTLNQKEYIYKCNSSEIDRLSELSSRLQCDKDSSLGCQP